MNESRPPGWFVIASGVIVCWAVGYLFSYNGGFQGNVFNENLPAPPEEIGSGSDPVAFGKNVFLANCAICHQPSGLGIPGVYPPLAGSEIVVGQNGFGENHLARIVMYGLGGSLRLGDANYNGYMAPWRSVLNDAQIAAVLTYIRQAWGNQAGPIAPEGIAALRAEMGNRYEPWTVATLRELPAGPLLAPERMRKANAAPPVPR